MRKGHVALFWSSITWAVAIFVKYYAALLAKHL